MTLKLNFFSSKKIHLEKMSNRLEMSMKDEEEGRDEGREGKLRACLGGKAKRKKNRVHDKGVPPHILGVS